ncbi:MAG: sugar ABC transporter ATP-binding protein [Propionicimonas sp.]|nr:sugar ABC transporter ATP-binding protein [Propionicimonas sp.]
MEVAVDRGAAEAVEPDVTAAVVSVRNVSKAFFGVTVLHDVSLEIGAGEIVTIMGENGAGKSTLAKLLLGELEPDGGEIVLEGAPEGPVTLASAKAWGMVMVHQELLSLPLMSITDNVFVGSELGKGGWLRRSAMRERTVELLQALDVRLSPDTLVGDLSIADRQRVEFARALNARARVIILDEPTSSLSDGEIGKLFEIMRKLRDDGVTFVFVSHRMNEVLEISDRIVVLKDGRFVKEFDPSTATEQMIISSMVGRPFDAMYHREQPQRGPEALRLDGITQLPPDRQTASAPHEVSLTLHEGEVLGLAGLVGAGRSELVKTIMGESRHAEGGRVFVHGKQVAIRGPADAIALGIAWVTEDRRDEGLIVDASLRMNIALPNLSELARATFVGRRSEEELATAQIRRLGIKARSDLQEARYLSGGNQQKAVLAKWLAREPGILILDEPTRGIDVGAKAEIYGLINRLTAVGVAILLISSDLPEVIGMSDRILVMRDGRISAEFERGEFSEEAIMESCVGSQK